MSDFLKLAGTVGDAVMGVMNANQQGGILHQMRSNANQAIPANTWRNIQNIEEAQQAASTGSSTPALLGAHEAIDDYRVLAEQQANQQNALNSAYQMTGTAGGLERLIAQLTGGLGGQYGISSINNTLGQLGTIFGQPWGSNANIPSGVGMLDNTSPGGAYPYAYTGGGNDPTLNEIISGTGMPVNLPGINLGGGF